VASITEIKDYLVGNDLHQGYLLDPDNNSKTIMISGKWGAGKTYLWKEIINPELSKNLPNDKSISYVSLYGKNNLEDIKTSVYLSAGKTLLSRDVATFGISALSAIKDSDLAIGKVIKSGADLLNSKKIQREINKLSDGGIICFDDFERKSKSVDLNDLFGFISQLAINLKCKVVIILNSDVFQGKEKNIFKNVKEKTVNKFLYYEPEIEELYNVIFTSKNYKEYINDRDSSVILRTLILTDEINARIYQQVLDNCYEWKKMDFPSSSLEALVLTTIYFILSHKILDYSYPKQISQADGVYETDNRFALKYKLYDEYALASTGHIFNISVQDERLYLEKVAEYNDDYLYNKLQTILEKETISESVKSERLRRLKELKNDLFLFWKYGYRLYFMKTISEEEYLLIKEYISTGILPCMGEK